MADEARVVSSLSIRKTSSTGVVILDYQSRPTSFQADVSGRKGPVPGAVRVETSPGTNINFSELTQPALCRIGNLDLTNFLTVGIWDQDNSTFFPLMEILPEENYVIRLSRYLRQEFGTGTGTHPQGSGHFLRLVADTAALNALVEAFEV